MDNVIRGAKVVLCQVYVSNQQELLYACSISMGFFYCLYAHSRCGSYLLLALRTLPRYVTVINSKMIKP